MTNGQVNLDTDNRSLMSSDGTKAVMETPDHWWACFTGYVVGAKDKGGRFEGTGVGSVPRWENARDFLDGRIEPWQIEFGHWL